MVAVPWASRMTTAVTSPNRSTSPGSNGPPVSIPVRGRSWRTTAKPVATVVASVIALSIRKDGARIVPRLAFGSSSAVPGLALRPGTGHPAEHRHDAADAAHDERDRGDVDELDPFFQPFDIAAQRVLDITELLAHGQHFAAEALDRRLVVGAQHHFAARPALRVARLLDAGELLLQFLQPLLQFLFLGAVEGLGVAAQRLDKSERTIRRAATAQPDQRLGVGQVFERVDDEIAVARGRDIHPLTEKVGALHPEPVVQHVGVADEDDLDRLALSTR